MSCEHSDYSLLADDIRWCRDCGSICRGVLREGLSGLERVWNYPWTAPKGEDSLWQLAFDHLLATELPDDLPTADLDPARNAVIWLKAETEKALSSAGGRAPSWSTARRDRIQELEEELRRLRLETGRAEEDPHWLTEQPRWARSGYVYVAPVAYPEPKIIFIGPSNKAYFCGTAQAEPEGREVLPGEYFWWSERPYSPRFPNDQEHRAMTALKDFIRSQKA